jgi:hypothetical protein
MVLLDSSEVCSIPLDVYLKFKIHFSIEFFKKWHLSGCALGLDFLKEEDFPLRNLLQNGGNRPQELLSGAPFPREVAVANSTTK